MSNDTTDHFVSEPLEYSVQVYRQNGQWKLMLLLPRWILDDLVLDSDNQNLPAILLKVGFAIATSEWHRQTEPSAMGLVKVEYIGKEKALREVETETDEDEESTKYDPLPPRGFFDRGK